VIQELRPRSVGEVLDAAVLLYRSRFGALMRVTILVIVPISIVTMFVLLSAVPEEETVTVGSGSPFLGADTEGDAAQLAAVFVTALLNALATAFVTATVTLIVADAYVGNTAGSGDAARTTWRRFLPIIGLTLASTVAITIGFFLCIVPGVWLQVAWSVAIPVFMLERTGVFAALGRSFALTKTKFWLSFGVYWLSQLLVVALSFGLGAGLGWVLTSTDSDAAEVIAQSVGNAAATVVTLPFAAAAIVALYFDLRIRNEAFDVQMMLVDLDRDRGAPPPDALPA
jgi:hypothetical protein